MRLLMTLVLLLIASAPVSADYVNPPISRANAQTRIDAIQLVLGQSSVVDLYARFHAELTFTANDDASHRFSTNQHVYCPGQAYVFASFDSLPDEHLNDAMYRWVVNVLTHQIAGPTIVPVPPSKAQMAAPVPYENCIDGTRPIALSR
jgi:hypothetical protein